MKVASMQWGVAALLLAACADTNVDPVTAPQSDASTADVSVPDADLACAEGAMRSCACTSGGAGTQTCSAGSYGACSGCSATQSKCVAGNYVGKGTGSQRPGALGVTALGSINRETGWNFSLAAASSSEFYTVGNGCIHVREMEQTVEDGSSRAYLTGDVNCATGQLDGEIKGFYTLPIGVKVYYKGTLQGTFDLATSSFINTKYVTREPAVVFGEQPGGEGTWTATLTNEPPITESEEECLMGPFPHELFK